MKKNVLKKIFMTVAVILSLGFVACSDDDDPIQITVKLNQNPIEYDSDGVWANVDENVSLSTLQYLVFSHQGEMTPWGLSWFGFSPARCSDTTGELLDNQFNVPTGGGMDGVGTPYLICSWNTQENESTDLDTRSCRIYYSEVEGGEKRAFTPKNVYVCNTSYVYHRLTQGDTWSRKFEQGDTFVLTAHGVKADGSETSADFYLADCRNENPDEWIIVNKWSLFDLSSLGEVTDIYFTMVSTDNGNWGMNTPAFFALDWLTIVAPLPEE